MKSKVYSTHDIDPFVWLRDVYRRLPHNRMNGLFPESGLPIIQKLAGKEQSDSPRWNEYRGYQLNVPFIKRNRFIW